MTPETIAHYRISATLGEGAMGKVYRATDSKLGREVAIKVIPDDFAADPVRMSRFTREAQVLASLNHPNIAAIYAVEDRALILELVEGPTLAERIARGAIPLEEALGLARQIADGLSAAHEKGIVHRDLKPANIKITPDGTIKILDFGLAKSDGPWSARASGDDAPTLTVASTGAGVILGTAAYMSPEQARGQQVDRRADVWAFGAIVYEMVAGSRLFAGETLTDVLASVVQKDPDVSGVPASVQRLLRRCLEKDPRDRVRDASDAMLFLESPAGSAVAPTPRRLLMAAGGAAAVSLIALAGLAFTHFSETPPVAQPLRFQVGMPDGVQFTQSGVVTISPDGRQVAFAAYGAEGEPHVWVRALDSTTATALAGAGINQVINPVFWSHDSRYIAFEQGGRLKRIPAEGGTVQVIAEPTKPVRGQWVFGGSWNRDNVVIFGTADGIMRVAAEGGTPTPLTIVENGESAHRFPVFLPDGRRFLYLRGGGALGSRYIAIGDLNAAPSAQSTTPIVKTDIGALAVPAESGGPLTLLYQRDATVFAQDFDAGALALTGEPVPIVERIMAFSPGGVLYFSASNTGTLVYRTVAGDDRQLTWFNRAGQITGTPGERGPYGTPHVSPDGTKVAVVPRVDLLQKQPNQDVWIVDLLKSTSTRLTFDPASDFQPIWSPDGKWVAWQWNQTGNESAFLRKAADGSGTDERLDTYKSPRGLTDWTRNGYLIFTERNDIWAMPVEPDATGTRTPVAVVTSPANEFDARVSPDNRWIAYVSDETGQREIFVQPFALGRGVTAGKWQVSARRTMGSPRWRSDSKELIFVSGEGAIVAVDVTAGDTFRAGAPRKLFDLPPELFAIINSGGVFDVTGDNERLLLNMPVRESSQREIGVFVNWASALRR